EDVMQLDGPHTYLGIKFPVRDATGKIYAVAGVSTDITERTRAEAALRRARDELEKGVQERTAELAKTNAVLSESEARLRAVLNRLIELSALRRDGSEFPVEVSISPMKTGDVVTFCGFITDLTERQRAEERFRSVVEASPNAIVLVNREGKITMVNAQTEKL